MAKKIDYEQKSSEIYDEFIKTNKGSGMYLGDKAIFLDKTGYYNLKYQSLGENGYTLVKSGKVIPYTKNNKKKIFREYFDNSENEGYWIMKEADKEFGKK